MQKIVFATGNAHKLGEVRAILRDIVEVVSPADIGFHDDVEETGTTFEENALIKAQAVFAATGYPCISDDSGLCVDALGGAPGVYSARYGGEPVSHAKNIEKLLQALEGNEQRRACFVAVLCAVGFSPEPIFAKGEVCGQILTTIQGEGGFGYDPIFMADGFDRSFAQLSPDEKNSVSHRGNAWTNLLPILKDFVQLP